MKHRALLLTSLLMTTAGAADLIAVRVNAPATVLHQGSPLELKPQRAIEAGDVVSAGARGKVGFQLVGSGSITLSSLGDVQVFDAQAARGKAPATAKLKLLAGALRVDSRALNGKPAQDVRLNVGTFKTRIFNADAWGANTAEGDTICLIAGVISVQSDGSDQKLEGPGNCLRREPDGQLSRFAANSDPVIVGAIAATVFDSAGVVISALAEEETTPDATAETFAPANPILAAASPAAVPSRNAPPSPAPDAKGGWTVVVLSLATAEPVAARAQALVDRGLPASTRTASVNGVTMHRVAVGSFATQSEARAYAASTLAASGIKGWAAPL